MPELPEVETIVRELIPILTGKTLAGAQVHWQKTICGDPGQFLRLIMGQTIRSVERRGKFICLCLESSYTITIHLRMTGALIFKPREKDGSYIRAEFRFTDDTVLYFSDVRKFGRIRLWTPEEPFLSELGIDPLLEEGVFRVLSSLRSKRPIKSVLLDQTLMAGIGNIYADEALFRSGIHPNTPADRLSREHIHHLSRAIPDVLRGATENRGSTISDYRSTQNAPGSNQFYLKVYGRREKACETCGAAIRRISINNRGSWFCPSCQPE